MHQSKLKNISILSWKLYNPIDVNTQPHDAGGYTCRVMIRARDEISVTHRLDVNTQSFQILPVITIITCARVNFKLGPDGLKILFEIPSNCSNIYLLTLCIFDRDLNLVNYFLSIIRFRYHLMAF